ncbi:hypothetical protein B0H14DRAFT_446029 [Mycena olivaceomarginata]|nr:hypothetical protein B0H14DRAFT_446029 [Mycena olivaceomarginata]
MKNETVRGRFLRRNAKARRTRTPRTLFWALVTVRRLRVTSIFLGFLLLSLLSSVSSKKVPVYNKHDNWKSFALTSIEQRMPHPHHPRANADSAALVATSVSEPGRQSLS